MNVLVYFFGSEKSRNIKKTFRHSKRTKSKEGYSILKNFMGNILCEVSPKTVLSSFRPKPFKTVVEL